MTLLRFGVFSDIKLLEQYVRGVWGSFSIYKTVGESVSQFPSKCTVNVYQTVRKAAERKCTCCVAHSFTAESKYVAESCFAVGDTLSQTSSHHRRIKGILLLRLLVMVPSNMPFVFCVWAQEMLLTCFVDCTNQKFTKSHQLKKKIVFILLETFRIEGKTGNLWRTFTN